MPSVRKVDAVWAKQVADLLDARGHSAKLILKEVGLDLNKIQKEISLSPFGNI